MKPGPTLRRVAGIRALESWPIACAGTVRESVGITLMRAPFGLGGTSALRRGGLDRLRGDRDRSAGERTYIHRPIMLALRTGQFERDVNERLATFVAAPHETRESLVDR